METLFIFLVKSSGLIVMFYLSYFFLLRKETFFNSNRWFLLAGLLTSVVLPLVVFTKIVWVDPIPTNFDWSQIPVTTTTPIVTTGTTAIENNNFEINWYLVLAVVYSIGILGFLLKFAFDFYSLSKVLKGKTIQKQADFKFIDVSENIAPFSYFNSIVYNSSLYSDTELENILEHEKVHSSQNHTVDVLVSRLFCVFFWFNPLVWLYKKAIVQNLEFIADSEASKNIADKKAYQLTLLKITTQENCVAITNHFYQSLIKKRIVMLNKNQSNKRNSWKYAAVLPLLGAFFFFFQVKVVAQENKKISKNHSTENKKVTENIKPTNNIISDKIKLKPSENKSEIEGEKSNPILETATIKEISNAQFTDYENENLIEKIEIVIKDNSSDDEILEKCQQINDTHNLGLSFYNINRNNNGEITHIESKYEKDFSHINEKKSFIWNGKPIQPFRFWYKKYKNGLTFGGYGLTGNLISRIIDNKSIDYKKAVILIDGEQSDYRTLEKVNPKEVKQVITKDINSRWPENKKYFELYGEKALYGILIAVETKNYLADATIRF